MSLITPGRIYGIFAALALLVFFVVPPQVELYGTACSVLSFVPTGCEVGVRCVFRGAILYCLIAGYLTSRILDREPVVTARIAPVIACAAVILFAVPLLIGLRAAFW
jgi:hypothetical protein